MLKMKYEALAVPKEIKTGRQNSQGTNARTSNNPDVGNSSFKISSSRYVDPPSFEDNINNISEIDVSPKKRIKTKMSRLSLKRMLHTGPDVGQSNLNRFLDLQTNGCASNKIATKPRKIKKSTKNLIENDETINCTDSKEDDKMVYKISTAIFGTQSKAKNEYSDNKLKKVGKKTVIGVSIESTSDKFKTNSKKRGKGVLKKIELTDKFDDKLDEKLQQGLEMEVEYSDIDIQLENIPRIPINNYGNCSDSPESKCPKVSVDLTSENNLELELIASKPKTRKCKSLELAKSPVTPRKVRFSNEVRSVASDKKFKRTPSYKTLPEYSPKHFVDVNESPKSENKNAFQFLMDMRNNVIGRNSPGKDKDTEESVEDKVDLTRRKSMLQEWANKKGNTGKRKLKDEERGEYIEFALDKRAKRLKKLLNYDEIEVFDENTFENRIKTSKYIEEMSKDINYTQQKTTDSSRKDINTSVSNTKRKKKEKIKIDSLQTVDNKPFKYKESSKNDLVDDSVDLLPFVANKTSKCKEQCKESSKNGPIVLDDESITSKKSFPIFTTVKSSPRKPLQQTFLFCISSIDNSSRKEVDGGEKIVVVKTAPLLKKKSKRRETLSLKAREEMKDVAEIKEISSTRKKMVQSEESSVNMKCVKDLRTAKKNRIIDLDELSSKSGDLNSTSVLINDKGISKNSENLIPTLVNETGPKGSFITKTAIETSKETRKYDITDTSVPDSAKFKCTKETSKNNEELTNLRRSSRARKPIEPYCGIIEEKPKLEIKSKKTKSKIQSHRDGKIASVFLKAVPKPKIDPAIIEARRNFLHSASPIKMKETPTVIENSKYVPFPIFSHTVQRTDSIFWNLPSVNLTPLLSSSDDNITTNLNHYQHPLHLGSFTTCQVPYASKIKLRKVKDIQNKQSILHDIKSKNPDYPVYKSYKLLKLKNKHGRLTLPSVLNKTVPRKLLDDSCLLVDSADTLQNEHFDSATLWTDKYKPYCSEDIIGNRSAAVDLLKFLKDRLLFSNESKKRKKSKQQVDSDDDFISSDDDNSNSKDIRVIGNTMLLRGPHGSGKTSSVYAVCQELDINVLELNASSKRTGRILIQQLQEATQSKQIHTSQTYDRSSSKMCLLLVEDIDVVFEQDDGFITALSQLLQTSKRPIVLTFTDETNLNVQRFIEQYPVITFLQLSAKTCSIWLQLVCLLENLLVDEESVGELLEWNKGDLRRTLLQLQFWGLTGGDSSTKLIDSDQDRLKVFRRLSADDTIDSLDDSNTSEVNQSALELDEFRHWNVVGSFYARPCLSLGQLWWNFGKVLERSSNQTNNVLLTDETLSKTNTLQSFQTFYESMSISDILYNKIDANNVELEPTFATYQTKLKNSLSLEQFEDCYTCEKDESKMMTEYLLDNSFKQLTDGPFRFNMSVPTSVDRRWRFKQHSIQDTFSDMLPVNIALHRKPFALDYFPMLISIVKIEQVRLKKNTKRRNRLYSYLRHLDLKFTDSQIKCLNNAFNIYR